MSRVARTTRTLLTGYSTSIVTAIVGLLVTPWIVDGVGDEAFAAHRVLLDYLSYVALLEIGAVHGLQLAVAQALSKSDVDGAQRLLRAGFRTLVPIAAVMLLAAIVLAALIPWLVPTSPELVLPLRTGVLILGVMYVMVPLTVYRALAEARQHGFVTHRAIFVQGLTISLSSLVMVSAGVGVLSLFIAAVAGYVLFVLSLINDGRSAVPLRALVQGPIEPGDRQVLRQTSGWILAFNVLGRIGMLSDSIIVTQCLGTVAVTPFFLTQRLPQMITGYLSGVGGSTWAAFTELYHQQQFATLEQRLIQLSRLSAYLGATVLAPVIVLNERFVVAWVGAERYAGFGITLFASVNAWMFGICGLWVWILVGIGRIRAVVIGMVIGTVVNLTVSIGATLAWGSVGPLIGSTVQLYGVLLAWTLVMMRQSLHVAPWKLLPAIVPFGLLAVPVVLLGQTIMTLSEPVWESTVGWPKLLRLIVLGVSGSVVAGPYAALGWWLLIPRADRDTVIQQVWKRRRGGPSAEAPPDQSG